MTIRLHRGDLPDLARYQSGAVAIDTETMGLDPHRDRLCVVQLSPGDGSADVVQIPAGTSDAPNLSSFSPTPRSSRSSISPASISACCASVWASCRRRSIAPRSPRGWCAPIPTGTASRTSCAKCWASSCRSSSNSPTGAPKTLTDAQVAYAASDVLHLHALRERLDAMLAREGRADLAAACFRFLPDRVRLDLAGWAAEDIFAHS